MGATPYEHFIVATRRRCGVCGMDTSKNVKRHFDRHHQGLEPVALAWGELPADPSSCPVAYHQVARLIRKGERLR